MSIEELRIETRRINSLRKRMNTYESEDAKAIIWRAIMDGVSRLAYEAQLYDSRIAKPGYRHALARRQNLLSEKQNRKVKARCA